MNTQRIVMNTEVPEGTGTLLKGTEECEANMEPPPLRVWGCVNCLPFVLDKKEKEPVALMIPHEGFCGFFFFIFFFFLDNRVSCSRMTEGGGTCSSPGLS